ncbi:hypothetical protein GOBAR_AA18570 [Gossypium barbadense]|uniref:Uncharacterized protein n=1 Tax=Gossypium barbadense TaxID=3634 RepID=A0A2P5XFK6_GOSBA|nr:hypothetical protein GOBAR_AA18570 [Gossypium barbadense]
MKATPVSTLPPEAQAPTRREYTTSPRKNGRIDKKHRHKYHNITLRSLLELLTYGETGEQNEELKASTMLRTNFENMHICNLTASASTVPNGRRGRKRKMKIAVSSEVEASIGGKQNDENALIDAPINDEAALINVPTIDEAALIDVPINYGATLIDVPIIDEVAFIDVPITYVDNFSDLGH